MSTLASYVSSVAMDGVETFKTARNNAKVTGKMIAHFLASKGHIFGNQTVSLMGFSLGSQVCKSTINRLSKLGINDLVQNVYLLAGATYIKTSKLDFQKQMLTDVVSGRIRNVHTKNDTTLITFQTIYGQRAIGRNMYYLQDPQNLEHSAEIQQEAAQEAKTEQVCLFSFENIDVTSFVSGHLDYRNKLDLILDFVSFSS